MIVKRLQLSEAFGKIMKDVESMESNLESVALPQDNPQQLFHSQQDLENHIQTLKVCEIILYILHFSPTCYSGKKAARVTQPCAIFSNTCATCSKSVFIKKLQAASKIKGGIY